MKQQERVSILFVWCSSKNLTWDKNVTAMFYRKIIHSSLICLKLCLKFWLKNSGHLFFCFETNWTPVSFRHLNERRQYVWRKCNLFWLLFLGLSPWRLQVSFKSFHLWSSGNGYISPRAKIDIGLSIRWGKVQFWVNFWLCSGAWPLPVRCPRQSIRSQRRWWWTEPC